MSINFLGPYYRAVIRQLPAAGEEKGKAVGFTTGEISPHARRSSARAFILNLSDSSSLECCIVSSPIPPTWPGLAQGDSSGAPHVVVRVLAGISALPLSCLSRNP